MPYRTIWWLDQFWPLEYRDSPVFKSDCSVKIQLPEPHDKHIFNFFSFQMLLLQKTDTFVQVFRPSWTTSSRVFRCLLKIGPVIGHFECYFKHERCNLNIRQFDNRTYFLNTREALDKWLCNWMASKIVPTVVQFSRLAQETDQTCTNEP